MRRRGEEVRLECHRGSSDTTPIRLALNSHLGTDVQTFGFEDFPKNQRTVPGAERWPRWRERSARRHPPSRDRRPRRPPRPPRLPNPRAGSCTSWRPRGANCTPESQSRFADGWSNTRVHATGGAKAFRLDPPARLRYAETAVNRAEATRREMAIKKLRRADKLALIQDAMMLTHDSSMMIIWI